MRGLLRVALFAVALGLGAFLVRGRLVDAIVFQPLGTGTELTLARLGLRGEELSLPSEDGTALHAFFLPARTGGPDEAAVPDAEGRALLFLHGNAGNASHRLPNAAALAALGIDVLLLDYRGYGKSAGRPSEDGVYADARAALAHLEARGHPARRIVVFGRSLGGAVAVEVARRRELAGVILESTFTSAADLGRGLLGPPGAWLAGDRFASDRKIAEVRAPLLFFHGDRDRVVPLALGERLFAMARRPKALEVVRGAGHNDTVTVGGHRYFERIRRFLDDVAPRSGAPRSGAPRSGAPRSVARRLTASPGSPAAP